MNFEERKATKDDIKVLDDLIDRFATNVPKVQKTKPHYLTTKIDVQTKPIFAYGYYNTLGNVRILDILGQAIEYDEESKMKIVKFITLNKLLKADNNFAKEYVGKRTPYDTMPAVSIKAKGYREFCKRYDGKNWLEPYVSPNNCITSYITQDGSILRIDEEKTEEIITAIMDMDVFPAKTIFENSCREYAKDNLEGYLKKLKRSF